MATKVRKMQDAMKAKPLSAAVLMAFFGGKDAEQVSEKVAAVEMPRVKYLFGFFPQSDLSDVKEAVKGLKADAKAHGEQSPQYRTAKVRAAEITALYGAWRFADLKEPVGGYKATVEAAREALKARKIRPTGEPIPEKWEKDVSREAGIKAAEWKEAEKARRLAEQKGETLTEAQQREVMQRTRDSIEKAGAVQMAGTIVKRKGVQFGHWLIEALEGAIAAAEEQAAEEKAKQEQEPQAKAA